ncbi:MAG: hypothetical protein AABZ44_09255, partial [Elusimicrobiota bacterium]
GWAVDRKAVVEILESPTRDAACFFYDYMEIGVGKVIVRLSIYRGDKAKPALVYNSRWTTFWHLHDVTAQFGADNLIFLHRFKQGWNKLRIIPCVFNVKTHKLLDLNLPDHFYTFRHTEGTLYGITRQTFSDEEPATEETCDIKSIFAL